MAKDSYDFNGCFAAAPWGGYKQSGLGRELGHAGLDEYTELKHGYQNHDTKALGWFGGEQTNPCDPS
jgi:betaine-aldehyde dehydrogenase